VSAPALIWFHRRSGRASNPADNLAFGVDWNASTSHTQCSRCYAIDDVCREVEPYTSVAGAEKVQV
jgi:hypothetical protein